jgi:hypothetical protein
MLGRLQMTARECRTAYLSLSERVFQPKQTGLLSRGKDIWLSKERFDSRELEEAIKDTIASCSLQNKVMFKNPGSPCKV